MGRKEFKVFDPGELGPEAIIGGRGRSGLDNIPRYFDRFERLVLLSRPESVSAFRKARAGKELIIEVGAGKGRFLTELARTRPDSVCLGLETGLSLCGHALSRADKRDVKNIFMAWGDARGTVPELVEPATAAAVYLLFPDPWWKKKHANRRHGPVMGRTLADALSPGGFLYLKSDVEPYLVEIVAAFLSTGMYDRQSDSESEIAAMPLTDREVRLKGAGTPIFSDVLVRKAD